MTDLLTRPILRVSQPEARPTRPVVLSALLAAGWAAGVGIVTCVLLSVAAWFTGETGSFGGAVRIGALAWLVGNGAGLHLPGATITAVPLGFAAMSGWLLYRGGRWAGAHSAVASPRDVVVGSAVLTLGYAALGALVAGVARSGDVHAGVGRTAAAYAAVSFACGGLGMLRGSRRGDGLVARLPEEARAALSGGLAGVALIVAAGALLVAVSLVAHFASAVTVAEGLRAGVVGGVIVALVGAAFVPNAVLCAGAFIAGPGFAVGSGTMVSPSEVSLGPLPGLPLLAALPRTASDRWWLEALIVIPVLAGAVAGLVALRRFPVYGIDHAALRGGLAGLAGGVGFGLMTWLATGAVGPGRMQEVGPEVLPVLTVCTVGCLLGGALAGVGARLLGAPAR